jgi:hypothetical protein
MIFRVCLPSTLSVDAGQRVFEPVCKMLGLDEELEGAFRPKGYCLMICPQRINAPSYPQGDGCVSRYNVIDGDDGRELHSQRNG